MIAFAWQTLLLLGLAYLLGCWIACLLRRMVGSSAAVTPRMAVPAGSSPMPEPAVAGESLPTPPLRATVPAVQPVRDAFRRADTMEPSAVPAAVPKAPAPKPPPVPTPVSVVPARPHPEEAADRFEKALSGPSSELPAKPSAPAAPPVPVTVAPVAAQEQPAPEPPAPPAPVAPPVSPGGPGLPDDLKRIRSIDQGLEAALRRLGVTRFAEIGAWKPGDVARLSQELGFKGRIEQENWIEQAQILASGRETHYSSRLGRDDRPLAPPPARDEAPRAPPPQSPSQAASARPETPVSIPAPAVAPPATPPLDRQPTASSSTPDHSVPVRTSVETAAAAAAALAAAAAAAKASMASPPAASDPVRAPAVSDKAAFAAENRPRGVPGPAPAPPVVAAPSPAVPASPAADQRAAVAARDNLQRISGVTPELEKLLQAQGVSRYSQIAQWSLSEVERFDGLLGHPGRIQRENWVEQAQILARGGDTAASREFDRRNPASGMAAQPAPAVARVQAPSAPVPTRPEAQAQREIDEAGRDRESRPGELAALRSVRSEGMRAATGVTGLRPAPVNDLKRIRGIGVLIEKRLNSMGVSSYAQIAEWTAADIERVSHVLDFKGRIERENWVEQARILASGGQTEFSHRADRNDLG